MGYYKHEPSGIELEGPDVRPLPTPRLCSECREYIKPGQVAGPTRGRLFGHVKCIAEGVMKIRDDLIDELKQTDSATAGPHGAN